MSILRTKLSFEGAFTMVPNAWVRDKNLSRKARGLLVEIMSHSAGWVITMESLTQVGPEGLASVRAGIQELEKAGYLSRRRLRSDDGTRLAGVEYTLSEPAESLTFDNQTFDNDTFENPTTKKNKLSEDQSPELSPLPGLEGVSRETVKRDPLEGFDQFWEVWPRKTARVAAVKAWAKAVRTAGSVERIVAGAQRVRDMVDQKLRDVTYVPYPATWLNAGLWDEFESGLSYPKPTIGADRFPPVHQPPRFDHSQQRNAISQLTSEEIAQLSAMGEAIGRPPFELFTEAEAADMIRNRKDQK